MLATPHVPAMLNGPLPLFKYTSFLVRRVVARDDVQIAVAVEVGERRRVGSVSDRAKI